MGGLHAQAQGVLELDHDFSNIMNLASAAAEPVTDEYHVLEQDGPDERCANMSRQLKYFLIRLCEGPSLEIIQSAETENGFEIWRLLCRRYSADLVASQHGVLGRGLESSFPETHPPPRLICSL